MKETVYLYNFKKQEEVRKIKFVMVKLGIRIKMIDSTVINQKVGYIADVPGFELETRDPISLEIDAPVLLMKGFTGRAIDQLLLGLRKAGVPKIGLKAVINQTNQEWYFADLVNELNREHQMMTGQTSKEQSTKVWYLNHSGFAVKTKNHFLIFDYYPEGDKKTGSIEEGLIDVDAIAEENVVVFVSHGHHDHYDPSIFEWSKKVKRIQYVLSEDIQGADPVVNKLKTMVCPDHTYTVGDLTIETLDSTDLGVAFLVKVDGITIYHAGDLNWWHWNGESEDYNEAMKNRYCSIIDKLEGRSIDIGFVVVDGRLEDHYLCGINYLCKKVKIKHIIPMHLFGNYGIIQELLLDECSEVYRDRIHSYTKKGQEFVI